MYLNSDRPVETALFVPAAPSSSGVGPWLLRRVLRHLECGRLTVILPSGKRIDHSGPRPGPDATIIVHNNRALRRLLFAGDVGFAEGYIAGDWSSPIWSR